MVKESNQPIISTEFIESSIYLIRGCKVMLDADLAMLYGVPTKRLNEQVRRNIDRFPDDFMFQLSEEELNSLEFSRSHFVTLKDSFKYGDSNLKSQIATSSLSEETESLRSQNATFKKGRGKHRKYFPYAFTEQGVAMLSSVLKSPQAISVNIEIMRAFVKMRSLLISHEKLSKQLEEVRNFMLKNAQQNTAEF